MLGSAGLLHDAWLDKEDNSRISDFVFRWLRPVSARLEGCRLLHSHLNPKLQAYRT